MEEESTAKHTFTYLRGKYVDSDHDYILCIMDGELIVDITLNLPWVELKKDCVIIPDRYDCCPAIENFYDCFVQRDLDTVFYDEGSNFASIALLKPNWKKQIKKLG